MAALLCTAGFPGHFFDTAALSVPGFVTASGEATEIAEPEKVGVRIIRRALIDSSTKATAGAPMRALVLVSPALYAKAQEFIPETRSDFVHIALADLVGHVYWQQNFVICRLKVSQSILPKELCGFVLRLDVQIHGCLHSGHSRT